MSAVTGVSDTAGASQLSEGRATQVLTTDDFLKIMITELTNQDPFEPMKNEALLNQMSAIQQIESNQTMRHSFDSLMEHFDQLLLRNELDTAGRMVGQVVSGKNTQGLPVYGTVVAVNVSADEVVLELDTGDYVKMTDLERVGGQQSSDIINQIVKGTTPEGEEVVGKVTSLTVSGDEIMLDIVTRDADGLPRTVQVPMKNAGLINKDNAATLLGKYAEGFVENDGAWEKVGGEVVSYRLEEGDRVILKLRKNEQEQELPLDGLTRILNIAD